jgi:predicted nucleic acid-binding protein
LRPILVDTGPLFALVDPDDQDHQRANEDLAKLNDDGYGLAVTYPTLLEAYTLTLHRIGIRTAHRWVLEIWESLELIEPRPDQYAAAVAMATHYKDQDITLFDSLAAVVAKDLRWPVWTYDHHFDVMGSAVWRR